MNDEIRILNDEKDKKYKRFTLLRDHISIKLSIFEGQLEEFLSSKASFEKFSFENLQACEIASYGLCALLSVVDSIKKAWEKDLESIKVNFGDCVASLPTLQT